MNIRKEDKRGEMSTGGPIIMRAPVYLGYSEALLNEFVGFR
jgi:hypothetical protein